MYQIALTLCSDVQLRAPKLVWPGPSSGFLSTPAVTCPAIPSPLGRGALSAPTRTRTVRYFHFTPPVRGGPPAAGHIVTPQLPHHTGAPWQITRPLPVTRWATVASFTLSDGRSPQRADGAAREDGIDEAQWRTPSHAALERAQTVPVCGSATACTVIGCGAASLYSRASQSTRLLLWLFRAPGSSAHGTDLSSHSQLRLPSVCCLPSARPALASLLRYSLRCLFAVPWRSRTSHPLSPLCCVLPLAAQGCSLVVPPIPPSVSRSASSAARPHPAQVHHMSALDSRAAHERTMAAHHHATLPHGDLKRKRSPSHDTLHVASAPLAKTAKTHNHLQINYLVRQINDDLPLITNDDTLPNILSLLGDYQGVLDRHESMACNLGARPLGPILIKRFERLFDGPPRVLKSNGKDVTTVTWLDVVEFARNKPEQFQLGQMSEGVRVCQFYTKQCRVQISEEDFVLISSGIPQKMIPPQPIVEDEEKELGTIEILEKNLGQICQLADQGECGPSPRLARVAHRFLTFTNTFQWLRVRDNSITDSRVANKPSSIAEQPQPLRLPSVLQARQTWPS
jgi:hypothetical protein